MDRQSCQASWKLADWLDISPFEHPWHLLLAAPWVFQSGRVAYTRSPLQSRLSTVQRSKITSRRYIIQQGVNFYRRSKTRCPSVPCLRASAQFIRQHVYLTCNSHAISSLTTSALAQSLHQCPYQVNGLHHCPHQVNGPTRTECSASMRVPRLFVFSSFVLVVAEFAERPCEWSLANRREVATYDLPWRHVLRPFWRLCLRKSICGHKSNLHYRSNLCCAHVRSAMSNIAFTRDTYLSSSVRGDEQAWTAHIIMRSLIRVTHAFEHQKLSLRWSFLAPLGPFVQPEIPVSVRYQ
jgi:hypothetical protein